MLDVKLKQWNSCHVINKLRVVLCCAANVYKTHGFITLKRFAILTRREFQFKRSGSCGHLLIAHFNHPRFLFGKIFQVPLL